MRRPIFAGGVPPRFWLILLAAPLALLNAWLVSLWLGAIANGRPAVDWLHYVEAGSRFFSGGLYDYVPTRGAADPVGYAYHYSPILAPIFGWLGTWLTADAWRYLHLLAIPVLPSRLMAGVALVSWPFWNDVESGNLMIFVLLAAAWALRGSQPGIGAFLVLSIVVPRPLMLPLVVWLLWTHPAWRWRFAALFVAHALVVLATGWGPAWVADLLAAPRDIGLDYNISPSRFIGWLWIPLGLAVAALLTLRGRPALAGVFLQPYLIGYYLLLPLAELAKRKPSTTSGGP